jgi:hypothetical protein
MPCEHTVYTTCKRPPRVPFLTTQLGQRKLGEFLGSPFVKRGAMS